MEFKEKIQLVLEYAGGLLDSVEKGDEVSVEVQEALDAHVSLLTKKSDDEEKKDEEDKKEDEEEKKEDSEEKEEAKKSAVFWESDLASAEIDKENLWQ